ncbi:hypothetical protein BH20ACT2_BH20ACT2_23460 [soil metagenome]
MRTTARRRSAPGPHQLRRLVESLDRTLVAAGDTAAYLIGVIPLGAHPPRAVGHRLGEVGLVEVPPGGHPLDLLTGWHAPDDWAAVGVATGGRCLVHGPAGPAGAALHLVLLVSRSGATAAAVRPNSGRGPGEVVLTADPPGAGPEGRLVEACLRVLGRPTRPPPGGTVELWARQWLDAVMAAAVAAPVPPLCWPEVAARHPHPAGDGTVVGIDAYIEGCAATAADLTWDVLRQAAAAGAASAAPVTPAEAAWMDDGMFARELLAPFPEVPELLGDLAGLVTADAHAGVLAALAAWGVHP